MRWRLARWEMARAGCALATLCLLPSVALADPTQLCVPEALGVPGAAGPPEWLSGPAPHAALDDPRWRGAASQSYGQDGMGRFRWRALHAQGRLHLSFQVAADPGVGLPENSVFIGLAQAADATHHLLRLQLTTETDVEASAAGLSLSHQTWASGSWQGAAPPLWVEDAAVWFNANRGDGTASWAVNIKIDSAGLGLAAPFKLWTGTQVQATTAPVATYDTYVWPLGTLGPWSAGNGGTPNQDILEWGDVTLGSAGCTTGVALSQSNTGVLTGAALGSTISSSDDNTFAAWPTYTGVSAAPGKVQARFRMASSSAPGQWQDVGPDFSSVPSAADGNIEKACLQGASPMCPTLPEPPANHCLLVELSSPQVLTFLSDSALSAGCDLTPPSSQGGAGSEAGAAGEAHVPEAGASTGGAAGEAGSVSAGGAPAEAGGMTTSGSAGSAQSEDDKKDDSGCSCTVPGGTPPGDGLPFLALPACLGMLGWVCAKNRARRSSAASARGPRPQPPNISSSAKNVFGGKRSSG